MRYAVITATCVLLAFAASGQTDHTIGWRNPPTPEQIAAADEVEFVVFAREPLANKTVEYIASAWEVRTRGEPAITPRVRFEPSSWSPDLLVHSRDHAHRGLIRLQVPDRAHAPDYRVNLYAIDYSDWTVTPLWAGAQALELFHTDDEVYLSTTDTPESQPRISVIRDRQLTEAPEQFEFFPSRGLPGWLHLVRRGAEAAPAYALFDARQHVFTPIPGLSEAMVAQPIHAAVNDGLTFLALHSLADLNLDSYKLAALYKPQLLPSGINALDLRTDQRWTLPISIWVTPGSGRLYMFSSPLIGFDNRGRLLYHSTPDQVCRFDPPPGADDPLTADAGPDAAQPGPARVPAPAPQRDDHEIAHAFLQRHGVQYHRPTSWSDSVVAFTPNHDRFLLKMFHSGQDSAFFLGDLTTDTLTRIPCPDSLIRANAMNLVPTGAGHEPPLLRNPLKDPHEAEPGL